MSNLLSITVTANGEAVTLQNPVGFGVNEFSFFVVETSSGIFMWPVHNVSEVTATKSSLVTTK